jgi:hypothetical protein
MKNREKIIYIVLAVVLVVLVLMTMSKSGYALAPQDLTISQQKSNSTSNTNTIFDLPYDVTCVPGPQETAAAYSKSLTPGGFCGDQQWVASQMDYTITDGIGSSLLS